MAAFNIVELVSDENPHLRAFNEIAELVYASLADLGHSVSRTANSVAPDARNIVLGAHVLSDQTLAGLPPNSIVYNFEQIGRGSLLPPSRLGAFRHVSVWDYSVKNVRQWNDAGIDAVHVPVGFHACLQTLRPMTEPDIDVLFYGSMNDRRRAAIEELQSRGIHVETLFGVYGDERDRMIERAKLVLNVHFYETGILEIARLSPLFANGIPVVSESTPDLEIPAGLDAAAAFASYEDIGDTVAALLEDDEARKALGERGRHAFAGRPMADHLEAALAAKPAGRVTAAARHDAEEATKVVFVLGCHRSGTSMVSRIVNLGGYQLTGPAIAPAADNPAGFWEDQHIAILDDRLMALLGSRWDDVIPTPLANWTDHPRLDDLRRQLGGHLRNSAGRRLLIKDPRITVLFPMWNALIDELGWSTQAAFVIRDPRAVAESLHRRNGFPRAKGILIWLHHVLMGEFHSRAVPRILVDYDTLLGNIESAAPQIHRALDMTTPVEEFTDASVRHVSAGLNHGASFDDEDWGFHAAAFAGEVYEAFREGADSDRLDQLRKRFLDGVAMTAPLIADYRSSLSTLGQRL